ncbi:hypothetical protein [uncultured Sphingomonas sp.]|uniref:hypothetical protein n=1 Tax=uncultured Sphingomonas sp. TaxID=158754 RepID=UPI0035CC708E
MTAARRYAVVAASLCALSIVLFWPGYAMYDSVAQYEQVVTGAYDDWHPPVMARLWSVLHPLGPGAAPMLVLQMALYWTGLGGIAAGLAAGGRTRGAAAMLAIGVLPSFLGWQAVVLKDAQATGALLAAAGLTAWWRLRGVRVPVAAGIAVVVLIAYATLARANAVFAAVPLGVLLLPGTVRWPMRTGSWTGMTLLVLALAPIVNHRLLGASSSGVERTAPLFDMAGIAARTPDADGTGLLAEERAVVIARRCARPFFWDPLGDPAHCGTAMDRLRAMPAGAVDRLWLTAIVRHPLAYAAHRVGHLNSTDRWLVAAHWPDANPPRATEPNALGLGSPGRVAVAWQRFAGALVETPLGWPIAWIVVAVVALVVATGRPRPARDMATALLGSALLLEASFAVLSIASDLRYHLWPMIATAAAAVLLADGTPLPRRVAWGGAFVLMLVIETAVAARVMLPAAPTTYLGMLG